MSYRDNVQKHCDRLFIPNPLRERDIHVRKVSFFVAGKATEIDATPMNLAGRFFFQIHVGRSEFTRTSYVSGENLDELRQKAAKFFAENWEDAEKVGRAMLVAFKQADGIIVHWR